MPQPLPDQNRISPELHEQIRHLALEYEAELKSGSKGNVAALVRRIEAEGRPALLKELFALRCEYRGIAEIDQVAAQWKMAFPEFGGFKKSDELRVNRSSDIERPLNSDAVAATTPNLVTSETITQIPPVAESRPMLENSESLPLNIHRQIDDICVAFEAALRAGKQPELSVMIQSVPPSGRQTVLEELLRMALEYRGGSRPVPAMLGGSPAAVPVDELERSIIGILATPAQGQPGDFAADKNPKLSEETKILGGPINPDQSTVIGPSEVAPVPIAIPFPRVQDYEILGELGRGGMGIVYKARQISLQRLVALKMVLRAEFATQDDLVRFRQEAESAAQLDHPGIVPVFEVGESEGRQYFSMAYVEGNSLSQLLLAGPLGLPQATELVRQLAVAVAYAHSRGIIHRDLKPGNVLLDKGNRPRITDFGLAKRLDTGSELTLSGQIVGTPSYMPPEQARGQITEIGPHSDIYSLGAVLYACITGRPPFQAANQFETLQQVLQNEPARPRLLNKSIPIDLETICLKCLAKRPSDRYPTAAHLGLDLGRWQRGEPIEARPINRLRRFLMWCQRHRSLAGAVGVAAVALVVLGFVQLRSWSIADQAKLDMANKEKELDAERDRVLSQRRLSQLTYADQQRAEGLSMTLPGGDGCQGLFLLAKALGIAHDLKDQERETRFRRDILEASRRVQGRSTLLATPTKIPSLLSLTDNVALSHLKGENSDRLQWNELVTGGVTRSLEVSGLGAPWAITSDGSLAAGVRSADRSVVILDGEKDNRQLEFPIGLTKTLTRLQFSADKQLLAGAHADHLWLWDIASGKLKGAPLCVSSQIKRPPVHEIIDLRIDTERDLISVLYTADAEFFEENKGLWRAEFSISSLAWTTDVRMPKGLGVATFDGRIRSVMENRTDEVTIRFYDASTGAQIGQPVSCPPDLKRATWDQVPTVASPNRRFVTCADAGSNEGLSLSLFDLKQSQVKTLTFLQKKLELRGGISENVRRLIFTPDSRFLIALGITKARVFDIMEETHRDFELDQKLRNGAYPEAAVISPDGKELLLGLRDSYQDEKGNSQYCPGTVQVYDVGKGTLIREFQVGHLSGVQCLAISPDDRTGYSGGGDNTVRRWDVKTGKPLGESLELGELVLQLALNPSGDRLLVDTNSGFDHDRELRMLNTQTWKLMGYPLAWSSPYPAFDNEGHVLSLHSPEVMPPRRKGRQYLKNSLSQEISMPESASYQPVRLLTRGGKIPSAQMSHHSAWFAILTAEGAIELRDVRTSELVVTPFLGTSPVKSFALSKSDREIIAGCTDGTIRRWLTPISLPEDPAEFADWIEWLTEKTWDPAQTASTPLSEERLTTLRKRFGTH